VARGKSIVVSSGAAKELASHVSALELPRRALSLPLAGDPPDELRSIVELWGAERELRRIVASWPFPARAWLVAEHTPIAYERSWPSGTRSPGVRMLSSLHRLAGSSRKAFEAHWLGPHTSVARSYTVPVWHYSQNVVTEALTDDSGEDGFVGMHFRTQRDLESRWADYPDEAARGRADAERFMDVARSVSLLAVETIWDKG
jgi:hypothetical protein